jgi:hypothetical protein
MTYPLLRCPGQAAAKLSYPCPCRSSAGAVLEVGSTDLEIFSATQRGGYGWSGSRSSMYAARSAPIEKLLRNGNPRLKGVAQIGTSDFSKARDANLVHEKRAAVRGELG